MFDAFMRLRTGQALDSEGAAAAAGRVDDGAVARVLGHPFFAQRPPKSLDRNALRHWVAEEGRLGDEPAPLVSRQCADPNVWIRACHSRNFIGMM